MTADQSEKIRELEELVRIQGKEIDRLSSMISLIKTPITMTQDEYDRKQKLMKDNEPLELKMKSPLEMTKEELEAYKKMLFESN